MLICGLLSANSGPEPHISTWITVARTVVSITETLIPPSLTRLEEEILSYINTCSDFLDSWGGEKWVFSVKTQHNNVSDRVLSALYAYLP